MDLKSSLIKLGSSNPELQPHLREILASLDKKAAKGKSLSLMHASFVSQVESHLDDLSRTSAVDGTAVTIQLSLSILSGTATLIYTSPWQRMAHEMSFPVTLSPENVAKRLLKQIESESRR